jgi:hypothetical protein
MFLRRGGGGAAVGQNGQNIRPPVSQSGQNILPAVIQSGQNILPAVSQNGQNIRPPTPDQHDRQSFHNSRLSSMRHLDERPSSTLPPIIDALLPVISSGSGLQVSTMTIMAKRDVHMLIVLLFM